MLLGTSYIDGGKPQEGSNQCCYGHENERSWKRGTFKLILSGTAAGTPDLGVGKYEHAIADVVPVHECGVEGVFAFTPSICWCNRGAGCKKRFKFSNDVCPKRRWLRSLHVHFRSRVNCHPLFQIKKDSRTVKQHGMATWLN